MARRDHGDIAFDETETNGTKLLRNFKPALPIGKVVIGARSTLIEFNPRKLTTHGSLTLKPKEVAALASLLDIIASEVA